MCSGTTTLLSGRNCCLGGWGLIPSCWRRSPECWASPVSVPFKCVFFPLPVLGTLPQPGWVGVVLKQVDLGGLLACVGHGQRSDVLPVQVPMAPLRRSLQCKSPFFLTADHCPQPLLPLPFCGIAMQGRQGLCGLSACIRT